MIRDKQEVSVEDIKRFQEEISYEREVARKLGVPIGIFDARNETEQATKFILNDMEKGKV